MKAVLFDLDDTLYPEIDFVRSGFRIVARYLSSRYDLDEDVQYRRMLCFLEEDGRGRVFNRLLASLNLGAEESVELLVHLYRSHLPTIRLYEDALPVFERLRTRNIRLGVVTDGMASVQRRKMAALGLTDAFDVVICTDELGQEHWKPSSVPFQIALQLLQVSASECVYVGNDPAKDFLGANPLGMLTIHVDRRTGQRILRNRAARPGSPKFVTRGLAETLPIIEASGRLDRPRLKEPTKAGGGEDAGCLMGGDRHRFGDNTTAVQ